MKHFFRSKDDSKQCLERVYQQCLQGTLLFPMVATELEFYYEGESVEALFSEVSAVAAQKGLATPLFKQEESEGQFEVVMPPEEAPKAAESLAMLKNILQEVAEKQDSTVDFSAKPYKERAGSGLHLHLHLENSKRENVFCEGEEGEDNPLLLYAIAGLLEFMPASMQYFAPFSHSYKRFTSFPHTPSVISWGGNNRTVALRLPTTTFQSWKRRIEHRVPASDADPYIVIACIVASVNYGVLKACLPASPKIYGNASDAQYALPLLPMSLKEAKSQKNDILRAMLYPKRNALRPIH